MASLHNQLLTERHDAHVITLSCVQTGVFHYGFPGVIKLAEGAFEAVVVYVYIKGLRHKDTVTFRGFMFAQVPAPARRTLLACLAGSLTLSPILDT